MAGIKLNYKIIFHFFGLLLLFNGGFMLIATLISFIYDDGVTLQLFLAGLATLVVGVIAMYGTKNHSKEMNKREGYIVVAFGWIVMSFIRHLTIYCYRRYSIIYKRFF